MDCIDKTAADVVKLLLEKHLTFSAAESCTGGLVSAAITSVSGSSEVYNEGICTYANSAKMKYLGVKEETLRKFGAVSENTAYEMATGMRKAANADIAVSVTGIAGPTGGTKEKPVGTVYGGIATKNGCEARLLFTDPASTDKENVREYIRYSTVLKILTLAKAEIEKM